MHNVDFEGLSIGEKFEVIQNQLDNLIKLVNRIKPECLEEDEEEELPVVRQPLGDFWVNLKDADNYYWGDYSYEDFVIGLFGCDANRVRHSGSVTNRSVAFPKEFYGASPDKTCHWSFGDGTPIPEWFSQENIDKGKIWVKPLCLHEVEPEDAPNEHN